MIVLQAAISGALLGGLFALMAIGLSLTWGMLKVINLAHFGLIILSAYLSYELATGLGIDPILTIALTVPVGAALGAGLQWAVHVFRISEFSSLLASFGALIVIVQMISNHWGADFRRMEAAVNLYATQSVPLGPLVFPTPTLLAFGFAVLIVAAGQAILARTMTGRALRAFAQDRQIAAAFGIDHERLSILLAAASGATAAIAGMLFALQDALTPTTPFEWIGIVFAVVILGGIGNVVGTLLAGSLVGAISGVVSVLWSPATAPFVVFLAIVLALLFRPRGLFGSPA
ncbi:MAG TPA: branched-chain amino acid ABC transporter permease [Candidatus Limnocylindrales bacterium]|nr:branched-chain amino acid ABC transporter permease [Candidatus Limnocylindrales bacterium]